MGQFWAVQVGGWHTFGSAPDDNSFYGVANGRDGCSMVPFSRAKRKSQFKECNANSALQP